MSCDRLSDLACLEWVRFSETRLAPETTRAVREHLEACEDCRTKVAGFERMERAMHPYGSPPPVDCKPVVFRRFVAVAIAAALVYACWFILS